MYFIIINSRVESIGLDIKTKMRIFYSEGDGEAHLSEKETIFHSFLFALF